MKITHNKVGRNLNMTDTAGKADKASKAGKVDDASGAKASALASLGETDSSSKVKLSERAQDMKKAKEIAKSAPEVRADRVAELQKLIDQGQYKVSGKDIADKMVDEELQWAGATSE
ncbi:MAG: hypothetical protein BroJett040_04470 [Oligoflexia bacterium]|nr:MAG: hypothetical protein BroJett040_04470 [Oligoflexia bacterium]